MSFLNFEKFNNQAGLSIIEVILASAIFVIFASGSVTVVLQAIDANRSGLELTQANQYASEGIEAAKSIKNQAFSSLVNSAATGIIRNVSNIWAFSGANNTFDKYTRVLKVEDVQRDTSGNIVASGGTVDTLTKKVTSTVVWNYTSVRPGSVSLVSYLSDWRKSISSGLFVYGDGTTTPKYRTYDNTGNTFSAETATILGTSALNVVVKTSPTKQEAIAGYVNAAGLLQISCFNGTNWTNEWSVTVGGNGSTRRFDIGYETNTGEAMVLYSTNTATTNELAYRFKTGTSGCGSANWAAAGNVNPLRTSGIIQWVKLATDSRASSNLISAIWADANSDLSAMVWSGSGWGSEPASTLEASLEVVTAAQDVDDFDLEYESLSGDLMVVWANSAGSNAVNGVRYATCTGGTAVCTWSAALTPPTFVDDATNLDISANPNTDEMIFASIGNAGSDLQLGYWSGSAWTNQANSDITAQPPLARTKLVATGWLISGATTRAVVVYNNAAATVVSYRQFVAPNTWTPAVGVEPLTFSPTPAFANPQKWLDIQTYPLNKDTLMLTVSDNGSDLFAKRLVINATPTFTWTNADSSAAIETTLGQSTTSPFGFSYWKVP